MGGTLGHSGHFWALWALLGTLGTLGTFGHFWAPRVPKNDKKCPEHPKMPRGCPDLPNHKKFYLKLFFGTPCKQNKTSFQSLCLLISKFFMHALTLGDDFPRKKTLVLLD